MAYNRENLLKRMIDVQEIYLHWQEMGLNATKIYDEHIKPTYHISRATFYNYLGTNAKKELKDLESASKQQQKLFNDEE